MLEIGKKAPLFKLKNQNGDEISLIDFRGKKVILYFYPKDNTPGCTTEACSFRDNLDLIQNENTVVLGVSADSIESHLKFSKKYSLNFNLLSDESMKMLNEYNVWKEKSLYGKKFMGIERTTVVIDENGNVKKIFSKVKVDGHTAEVMEALKN